MIAICLSFAPLSCQARRCRFGKRSKWAKFWRDADTKRLDKEIVAMQSCFRYCVYLLCSLLLVVPQAYGTLQEGEEAKLTDAYTPDIPNTDSFSRSEPIDPTSLLGERFDHFSGRLSFLQTDLDLPGNFNLPVRIARVNVNQFHGYGPAGGGQILPKGFGDWYLDIPFLTIINHWKDGSRKSAFFGFCQDTNSLSQIVGFRANPVPVIRINGGSKTLRVLSQDNAHLYPAGTKFVTDDHWVASCLPINDKNMGLKVTSPSGEVYLFDRLAPSKVGIYSSKVTDLNGNWVKYTNIYRTEGLIEASDGRRIRIGRNTFDGPIVSATAGDRTWRYEYDYKDESRKHYLRRVIRPDGRAYDFSSTIHGKSITSKSWKYWYKEVGKSFRLTMSHPNGFSASYDLIVDFECDGAARDPISQKRSAENCAEGTYNQLSYHPSLTTRQISLPSGESYRWDYHYSVNDGVRRTVVEGEGVREVVLFSQNQNRQLSEGEFFYGSKISHKFFDQATNQKLLDKTYSYHYWDRANPACSPSVFSGNRVSGPSLSLTFHPFACTDGRLINSQLASAITDSKRLRLVSETTWASGSQYSIEYLNYDRYNQPILTLESNGFSPHRRYVSKSYRHSLSPYRMGALTRERVSPDNSSWVERQRLTYDGRFNVSSRTRFGLLEYKIETRYPDGSPRRIVYNVPGRWLERQDYKAGVPQKVSYPSRYDSESLITYENRVNLFGDVTYVRDPNGNVIQYDYDSIGRLTSIDYQDSHWLDASIQYVAVNASDVALHPGIAEGQFKKIVSRGNYRSIEYLDGVGRVVLLSQADRADSSASPIYQNFKFDAHGRQVFRSYSSGAPKEADGIHLAYDVAGRLISRKQTSTGHIEYFDYLAQNRLRHRDFNGNATAYHYLAFGVPSYEQKTRIVHPENIVTSLDYNLIGNVVRVASSGFKKQYIYDEHQRLCKSFTPETGWTYYGYNGAGELTWLAEGLDGSSSGCDREAVNAKEKQLIQRDNLGNIWGHLYPDDTPEKVYTLDNNGNVVHLDFGDISWSFAYNTLNKEEQRSVFADGHSFVVNTQYNQYGHVSSMTYPSGRHVRYRSDAFGRIRAIDNIVEGIVYHPTGSVRSMTYANGTTYRNQLNRSRLPESLSVLDSNAMAMAQLQYTYDSKGNVLSILDHYDPSRNIGLGYDQADRLVNAQGYWGSGTFSYDPLGNITSQALGTDQLNYTYDDRNRLAAVYGTADRTFEYDRFGSVTHDGRRNFSYNLAGNLKASGDVQYEYDVNGQRVVKRSEDGVTTFIYGRNGRLLYQKKANGDQLDYVYLNSNLVGTIESR